MTDETTKADAPEQPAVLPAHMMTPQVIHENLFGKIADFVGENLKGDVIAMPEPGTGVYAPFLNNEKGIDVIPADAWDDYRDHPRWRHGTANLLSLDSFIAHVNRFKNDESAVFANNSRTSPSVTAVIDYHDRVSTHGIDAAPQHGRHRSTHAFPLSDEWKAWNGQNKQGMTMKDFAAFLEDHIIDVLHPSDLAFGDEALKFINAYGGVEKLADPARLIELSQSFHVYENAQVRETKRLSDGTGTILFDVTNVDADGKPVAIPTMFGIWIPVFKMDRPVPILARLRYRIANGAPVFWYELWRTDKVFDEAFDNAVDKVVDETGLPVFLGTPEA